MRLSRLFKGPAEVYGGEELFFMNAVIFYACGYSCNVKTCAIYCSKVLKKFGFWVFSVHPIYKVLPMYLDKQECLAMNKRRLLVSRRYKDGALRQLLRKVRKRKHGIPKFEIDSFNVELPVSMFTVNTSSH